MFHDTAGGRLALREFNKDLRSVLKKHESRVLAMNIPGPNGGIYLKSREAAREIMSFMYRKMAKLLLNPDVTCTWPTQSCFT